MPSLAFNPRGMTTDWNCIDKYGWEAGAALLTTAIIMTCVLRFLDARYFRYVVRTCFYSVHNSACQDAYACHYDAGSKERSMLQLSKERLGLMMHEILATRMQIFLMGRVKLTTMMKRREVPLQQSWRWHLRDEMVNFVMQSLPCQSAAAFAILEPDLVDGSRIG